MTISGMNRGPKVQIEKRRTDGDFGARERLERERVERSDEYGGASSGQKQIIENSPGLRPGEKLFEELFHGREPTIQTGHAGLLMATPRTADPAIVGHAIGRSPPPAAVARDVGAGPAGHLVRSSSTIWTAI